MYKYLCCSLSVLCTYLSTEVIIEFLYGMCALPLVAFSYSATITISRKKRDVLMYLASVRIDPLEFVFPTLSLPARSTKWSLDLRIMSDPIEYLMMFMFYFYWNCVLLCMTYYHIVVIIIYHYNYDYFSFSLYDYYINHKISIK